MNKRKPSAVDATSLILGIGSAALLGAAAVGAYKLLRWAKDPYATELWLGLGGKGVLVSKDGEPHCYRVRTGFAWQDDGTADELSALEEPEMEIPLPDEYQETQDAGDEA